MYVAGLLYNNTIQGCVAVTCVVLIKDQIFIAYLHTLNLYYLVCYYLDNHSGAVSYVPLGRSGNYKYGISMGYIFCNPLIQITLDFIIPHSDYLGMCRPFLAS